MRVSKWFWLATLGVGNVGLAQKADRVQKLQAALQKEAPPSEVGRGSPATSSAMPQEEKISTTAPSLRLAILREEVADPAPSPQEEPTSIIRLKPALNKELKPE